MTRLRYTNRTWRLTIKRGHIPAEIKNYVINLLAQEKGHKEIVRLVKDTHGSDISPNWVSRIYKNCSGEIEEMKGKFLVSSVEVPIAIERIRLERDEALYQLSQGIAGVKDKIYASLAVLKEAREETKGSQVSPNLFQFNQFNSLSDEELLAKKKQLERKIFDTKKVGV